MKFYKNKKLIIIAIIVLILIGIGVNLGNFLIVNDELHKADAIAVFSGDDGPRTEKGVGLLKQGLGDYLILSGGNSVLIIISEYLRLIGYWVKGYI